MTDKQRKAFMRRIRTLAARENKTVRTVHNFGFEGNTAFRVFSQNDAAMGNVPIQLNELAGMFGVDLAKYDGGN